MTDDEKRDYKNRLVTAEIQTDDPFVRQILREGYHRLDGYPRDSKHLDGNDMSGWDSLVVESVVIPATSKHPAKVIARTYGMKCKVGSVLYEGKKSHVDAVMDFLKKNDLFWELKCGGKLGVRRMVWVHVFTSMNPLVSRLKGRGE